ncbi:hypothetical protein K523DRAFT_319341 [Schizophyllum commune Tattone D]|nr:hypothetical protein K523DRAFT_319341 [Schizophyllum commune Tattone D]
MCNGHLCLLMEVSHYAQAVLPTITRLPNTECPLLYTLVAYAVARRPPGMNGLALELHLHEHRHGHSRTSGNETY